MFSYAILLPFLFSHSFYGWLVLLLEFSFFKISGPVLKD